LSIDRGWRATLGRRDRDLTAVTKAETVFPFVCINSDKQALSGPCIVLLECPVSLAGSMWIPYFLQKKALLAERFFLMLN
jgi:hypothetical protein